MSNQCRHGKLARQCEVCQLEADVRCLTDEVRELEDYARGLVARIRDLKLDSPRYHPELPLLAAERTGWRRYVFGRWVYSDEPFRRDVQRRIEASESN